MNKIIYLIVAAIIVTGLVITLNAGKEEAGEMINSNYGEAEMLETEEANSGTKATDYNSSRSNRTTAGAVNPDDTGSGDATNETVDNDCSGPDGDMSACAPGDPVPGIGITEEQSVSGSRMDSDDDGDTVSAEDKAGLRSE